MHSKDLLSGPATYTQDELRQMLADMQSVSNRFYGQAVQTRCHPFIEFCGFMNEFIKICENALKEGVDFTETTIHSGGAVLPMEDYHAGYIGEKFGCIFGHSFTQDPKLLEAFLSTAFGGEAVVELAERVMARKKAHEAHVAAAAGNRGDSQVPSSGGGDTSATPRAAQHPGGPGTRGPVSRSVRSKGHHARSSGPAK